MLGSTFHNAVSTGNLLTVIAVFGCAFALVFTIRSKIVAVWKENYEGQVVRNKDLHSKLQYTQSQLQRTQAALEVQKEMRDIKPVLNELARAAHTAERREQTLQEVLTNQETMSSERDIAVAELTETIQAAEERILEQLQSMSRLHASTAGIQERIAARLDDQKGPK